MHWNHRVLVHLEEDEPYFQIYEVYYTEEGKPNGYANAHIGGEKLEDMAWTISNMVDCLDKPILIAGDRFPEEYKP